MKALAIGRQRYRDWCQRYGKLNEHNHWVPRDHWLLAEERQQIIDYYQAHSAEGYRRLTYLMMDADIVYASPSTTYRVLRQAGLLRPKERVNSKKGTGFVQPLAPHRHWHIDITYLKIKGVFYYLILVLDGYSRYLVGWALREQMTEADVEIAVQQAHEAFPDAKPRIISDNGSQFIAKEFKQLLTHLGMTHVTTSPYYPQSKENVAYCTSIERFEPTGSMVRKSPGAKPPRLTWLAAA